MMGIKEEVERAKSRLDALQCCIIPHHDAATDQASFGELPLSTCEEVRAFVRQMASKNEPLRFPLVLPNENDEDGARNIKELPVEETMLELLRKENTYILVNGLSNVGPHSTDKLNIDLVDFEEGDDESPRSALFRQLIRRISLYVADADLSLSQDKIRIHAERVLGMALLLDTEYCDKVVDMCIGKLFGFGITKGRIATKTLKLDKHQVDCQIITPRQTLSLSGCRLGVLAKTRVEIYFIATDEAKDNSSILDPSDKICTIECDIVQPYALIELSRCHYFDSISSDGDDTSLTTSSDFADGHMLVTLIEQTKDSNENSKDRKVCESHEKDRTSLSKVVSHIEREAAVGISTEVEFGDRIGAGSDLYGWGLNIFGCLGLTREAVKQGAKDPLPIFDPKIISIQSLPLTERIASISTSVRHTLLVTTFGSVYSCGQNEDGQLGNGTYSSCTTFQLVDWFLKKNIQVKKISAGSNGTISHSAAISNDAKLYTWGYKATCGHTGQVPSDRQIKGSCYPRLLESFKNMTVLKISCGGGFSVALIQHNKQGEEHVTKTSVYTWGLRNHGLPSTRQYQQAPIRIIFDCVSSDCEIIDVSAGLAHALAVARNGEVLAWGKNSQGQCSCSFTLDGSTMFDGVLSPQKVPLFGVKNPARTVTAGSDDSVAIDSSGRVWTWGGGNRNLGRNLSALYDGDSREATHLQRVLSGNLQPPPYALPKLVESLNGVEVSKVALGDANGLAVTRTGAVFAWDKSKDVNLPMQPLLPTTRVSCIDAAGRHMFAVSEGSYASERVGLQLLGQAMNENGEPTFEDACEHDYPEMHGMEDAANASPIDCVVHTGQRHKIPCHQAILACRSSVFAGILSDLIARKRLNPLNSSVLSIFLTDVEFESAEAMIFYLYADTVKFEHLSSRSRTRNLMFAAKQYNLTRLAQICNEILIQIHGESLAVGVITESTMTADLFGIINDPAHADLIVKTSNGDVVYAHKSILLSQAPTLSSLIQVADADTRMHTMELAGSFESILRIITFVYTGIITSADDELMEDIQNAKGFQLVDAYQYECMMDVTSKNAIKVLNIALDNELVRLTSKVFDCIAQDVGSCFCQEESISECINALNKAHPGTGSTIFEAVKNNRGPLSIIPKERLDTANELVEKAISVKKARLDKVYMDVMKGLSSKGYIMLLMPMMSSIVLANAFPPGPWIFMMNIVFSGGLVAAIFYLG